MTIPSSCDVVVIGGGPGGSTAASLLARQGHHVVLLEKARHPRFTVGESLLPHAWRVFDLLGMTERVQGEGFVVKQGGTVVWDQRIHQMSFTDFGYTRPGLHVERDRFDSLLLERSVELGALVHQETAVRQVEIENGAGPRVHYQTLGENGFIDCQFVVDASGQSAVLSRQMGGRTIDEDFRFVALWGYFENSRYVAADGRAHPFEHLRRVPPTTFVSSLGDWGWSWHIPLRRETSVGLVIPVDRYRTAKRQGEEASDFFLRTCETTPFLGRLLEDARLLPGRFHVIRDYSYVPGRVAGPGYYLVGDAAAFVDPVFSLGVVLAMYSGQLAAWAIDRTLRRPERGENATAMFTRQFQGRYDLARAMAIPGRALSEEKIRSGRTYLGFQSDQEQDLMCTVATLTTRSRNFHGISAPGFDPARLTGKYRTLDTIKF